MKIASARSGRLKQSPDESGVVDQTLNHHPQVIISQQSYMSIMLGLFNVGGGEIILILAIVLILFGAKKLPELAKGLGQGIREFKKATDNASDGLRDAVAENPLISPKRLVPPTTPSTAPENAALQATPGGPSDPRNQQQ